MIGLKNILAYRLKTADWVIVGWNVLVAAVLDWGRIPRTLVAVISPLLLVFALYIVGGLVPVRRGRTLILVCIFSALWYFWARHFPQ